MDTVLEDNLRWVMVVMVPMFIIVHCDGDIFVTVVIMMMVMVMILMILPLSKFMIMMRW